LKDQLKTPQDKPQASSLGAADESPAVGEWLEKFISLDNNPHSARLVGQGSPYSVDTMELYRSKYNRYIKDDPLLVIKMSGTTQLHILEFMERLGLKKMEKHHGDKPIAGTRTYEITIRFVRMAFKEYWRLHDAWQNPFDRIDAPKSKSGLEREAIEESEFAQLFVPGVITDPLDRALCAAMFWAGLRRSELFGLKPEDLNWQDKKITIRHAWKMFSSKKKILGDPKWHKERSITFPDILQAAIKELWAANGKHDFVFSRKDGSIPSASYIKNHLPKWIERAGIELNGRKIVPHSARHSLASALEAKGVPLRYIGDMLGHSSLKTTRGYLHTISGAINDMGAKIDEMANKNKKKVRIAKFGSSVNMVEKG
jgi:integrase